VGAPGAGGAVGAAGARGAAATVLQSAVLLHTRLATTRGRRFTIRYLSGPKTGLDIHFFTAAVDPGK